MTAFERREQIIERMKIRKFDTALNLAIEFKVSKRTILRDVQELSCAGYQIQCDTGNGGGVRWTGNKKQFPFSEEEINSLKKAIEVVSLLDKLVLENLIIRNTRVKIKANDVFEILEKYKTQREVAFMLNISESHLSRLLSGQKKPSEELTNRILELKAENCSSNDVNT